MAFIQKISSGNTIDIDGTTIYVADLTGNISETVYTPIPDDPGNFTGVVNVTGYGAPNITRSSVALFLVAYIKKTTGNLFLNVKSSNPLTVTKFEVTRAEDGFYNFHLISIPAVASPVLADYTEGKLVYNTTDGKIYEKKSGVFVNIPVTDLNKYITGVYSVAAGEKPVLIESCITLNKNVDQKNDLLFVGGQDTVGIKRYQENINLLIGLIRGSSNEFSRGNKMIFQRNVEFINNNALNCGC